MAKRKPQETNEETNGFATIRVPPLSDLPPEMHPVFIPRKVETRLDHSQGVVLKRLHRALDESGARLANGNRVRTNHIPDAVRWLLDQIVAEKI
jgi:hypothetical protein